MFFINVALNPFLLRDPRVASPPGPGFLQENND